ncbi:hypothetical protein Q669_18960 [Labrenzia sp. C1B10]|nr:hypothetical protein Q669_18960 [Labrenzia sp. C1B10]ERP99893.1 hypothetical protein Q675_10035 [Labrenzia sp. C1B70]
MTSRSRLRIVVIAQPKRGFMDNRRKWNFLRSLRPHQSLKVAFGLVSGAGFLVVSKDMFGIP